MAIIDLSKLPAPNVIETLDYETVLADRKAKLLALVPAELQSQVDFVLGLETEPLTITLQENAYRELVLRNRINDAAKAVLLAYAVNQDLDQIGARHNVERLVVVPADPTAIPPVDAVMETDDRFRQRIQMAYDGLTIAGTYGAYAFHALTASGRVYDVKVEAPANEVLVVRVNLVDTNNEGIADATLCNLVESYLSAEERRPLCDIVQAHPVSIINYSYSATLYCGSGASINAVKAAAEAACAIVNASNYRIGTSLTRSSLLAGLRQSGVELVDLTVSRADGQPVQTDGTDDVLIAVDTYRAAARCTGFTITAVING